MDARGEGTFAAVKRPSSLRGRPGPLCAPGADRPGESTDRPRAVDGPSELTSVAPLLVGHLHEGLRPRRGRPSAAATGVADLPPPPPLRASLDDLRPGDRARLSRRGGHLRRPLPHPGAAEPDGAGRVAAMVQEHARRGDRPVPPDPARERRPSAHPPVPVVEHAGGVGPEARQAVRDVRPFFLRVTRCRVAAPDVSPDVDNAHLRPRFDDAGCE